MAPHTTSSEHNNQTQIAADDIAAAPSRRDINSIICRKQKKFYNNNNNNNNNNNTERSTTESRRVRKSPSPHPQDPGDTSRTQGRQKQAHTEEGRRTPNSHTPRDPRAAMPPGCTSLKVIQENVQWSPKRPPPKTWKQIKHQRKNPH
jgi:hypothetical protein